MLARFALGAALSLSMVTGTMAWDGARAYHLRPAGTSDISLTMNFMHITGMTNLGFGDESTELGVVTASPAYRHSFDAFGTIGTVLIGIPVGVLDFETSLGTIDVTTDIAQGDLFVGGAIGLVGMPALSVMDYVQHTPGFQASAAARLFLPTGDYDPDRAVNIGGNRWSLEASLPMTYVLGDTMLDPDLTTFEIRPVVQIFGDNDDAVGPGSVMSQDPIFGVEGHVTRNFGNSIWAALDAYYDVGGETAQDGVAQGDGFETFSVGATLGVNFSPTLAMRISYREQIYSSVPDTTSRTLEVTSAFLF